MDREEVEALVQRAKEDTVIGEFLMRAMYEHCEDEDHLVGFLVQLIANMGINKILCPHCMQTALDEALGQLFEVSVDSDGDHTVDLLIPDETVTTKH